MSLVRSEGVDPALDDLQATLAELDTTLKARTQELAQARVDLEAFRIRYRQDVGRLHEELDELLDAIAELELKELSQRLKEEGYEPSAAAAAAAAMRRAISSSCTGSWPRGRTARRPCRETVRRPNGNASPAESRRSRRNSRPATKGSRRYGKHRSRV